MSQTRKAGRLLRFIEEYGEIVKYYKAKELGRYLQTLQIISHLFSFFFFIFDNLLWLALVQVITLPLVTVKVYKDLSSLCASLTDLIIAPVELRANQNRNRKYRTKVFAIMNRIQLNRKNYEECKIKANAKEGENGNCLQKQLQIDRIRVNILKAKYLEGVRINRYHLISTVQIIFRGCTLLVSLQMLNFFSNFWVAVFGFIAAFIDIYKSISAYYRKKRAAKLQQLILQKKQLIS